MEHLLDTPANTDQAEEEILTFTLSDGALEAAAGTEKRGRLTRQSFIEQGVFCGFC